MKYFYFGHIIESDIDLPELGASAVPGRRVDVSFSVSGEQGVFSSNRDWLHHWKEPDEAVTISFAQDEDALYLHFPGLARFAICNNGRQVTCYLGSALTAATIRHLLLDQVLPRLFAHFYPYMVFHASFLSVNGKGICFLADSGWGKSTIAAAIGAAGNTILNDDCVGLVMEGHEVLGRVPYCGIRLLPDSIKHFGDSLVSSQNAVSAYTSKQRICLNKRVVEDLKDVPMQAFFLLSPPDEGNKVREVEVSQVAGMHAMKALLKNTFCFNVHDERWQKKHFMRVSALIASGLPVYSINYPRDYSHLPSVVGAVLDTLE